MGLVEQVVYPGYSGLACVAQGDYEEGYARLSACIQVWEGSGAVLQIPQLKIMLGQACLGLGRTEQAEALIRGAMEVTDKTGHRMYEVEAHRVLAEVLWARNDPEAAATEFFNALEIAKSRQAKSWELRAATSLARLWRDQSRRDEARELLAPVYGWFTEGFDTRDLKEAKMLLEELGS